MLTTLVLAAIAAQPLTFEEVGEYFPLNTGDSWVYQEEGDDGSMRVTDTVGELTVIKERVRIGGKMSIKETEGTPVITTRAGRELSRAYYSISEGEVRVVALMEKAALETPYPIVRLPGRSSKWSHSGDTVMEGAPADVSYEASVKKIRQQPFEDGRIDAIEVRLVATMLEKLGTKFTVIQVAIYGKGVGLLSMKMETILPRRKIKSTRTLISYKPKSSE